MVIDKNTCDYTGISERKQFANNWYISENSIYTVMIA